MGEREKRIKAVRKAKISAADSYRRDANTLRNRLRRMTLDEMAAYILSGEQPIKRRRDIGYRKVHTGRAQKCDKQAIS